jgi:hypothetical protein
MAYGPLSVTATGNTRMEAKQECARRLLIPLLAPQEAPTEK